MEPSDGFAAFVAAYEAGSITAGAERLGMPRATLSRQLSRLEERLGTRLVHRDTHSFHPTQAGEELYQHARNIVADSCAALDAVRRHDGVPRGLLRVSMLPGDSDSVIGRMLVDFARQWPEVRLEIHTSSAHVDLRAERFDVALRAGPVRDPDLVARTLIESRVGLVASPGYLARRGVPATVADLDSHDLLVGFDAGTLPARTWPLLDGGTFPVEGRTAANDITLLRLMALDDQGIALLPEILSGPDVEAGRLVPVLADVVGTRSPLSVVFPERTYLLPKVRVFVDHVVHTLTTKGIGWHPLRNG